MTQRLALKNLIMNASGPRTKTFNELQAIYESHSAAVVSTSCTFYPILSSNPSSIYTDGHNSINAVGLKNLGFEYYASLSFPNKPYIMSLAPTSHDTLVCMLKTLQTRDNVNAIELNLSCPNTTSGVIAYDVGLLREMLDLLPHNYPKPIGIKLPPFYIREHMRHIVQLICQYPQISFLTSVKIPLAMQPCD